MISCRKVSVLKLSMKWTPVKKKKQQKNKKKKKNSGYSREPPAKEAVLTKTHNPYVEQK